MKRSYVLFNKDSVTDVKIFDDLRELSRGQIEIHAEDMQLLDAQKIKAAAAAVKNENKQGKKKKKK
jgi:aspartyl/asparaginyl beta-hydroxylase (cupin superfamily)